MLSPYNEYLLRYVVKETIARNLREAEVDYVLNQPNSRRSSRLAQAFRRPLHNLAHALVVIRRQLDIRST